MVTFAEQLALDNNAKFNTAELASTVNYGGVDIPAHVERGQDRGPIGRGAVASNMFITVRKPDVVTTAKDTPVVVDGENWKVWERVGGTRLTWRLKLYSGAAVMTRRMY